MPNTEVFVNFNRKQFKTNPERLARRRAKRHNESFEQVLAHYKSMNEPEYIPFIQAKSLSSNTCFPLFIEKNVIQMVQGEFNCYGLSKTATVPWF